MVRNFVLSLLLAVVSGHAVHAAGEPQQMDEVVVSGSRATTRLSETPVSIGVVDEKSLKRDKPKTMGDVINRIPGVSWVDLGNEQHMMGIRQPNSTGAVYQYLEDGIPIRPLGVFNHNSLNEMNLSGTERVEVVKGAASSLYGSNAIGGAINFITAPPSLTPYASVGARNESKNGFSRFDAATSNSWGGFGVRVSAYSSRRNANWQDYSTGSKDSVTLRSDYALGASSLVHAVLSYNNLDSATPGSLNPSDYHTRPGYSLNTFSWRKDKTTRLTAVWEGETLHNGTTTATLFGRRNDHGQLPNYTITGCAGAACNGTINNNHVGSSGLDVKHQQEFSWLSSRLVAGLYFDKSSNPYVSDNLKITRNAATGKYLSYTVSSAAAPLGVRNYETGIKNTALFAQWELSPLERVHVVLGGRADNIRYDFRNNLTPGANYGAPSESRGFSHFSPKIGATYAVNNRASVYVNASEGFRPPEVSELYGKTTVPDLTPATYNNYEAGLRMVFFDALKMDAALYRLEGRDTIVSYIPVVGTSFNKNAGRTRSQGLEVGLGWDKGAAFDARMSASFASHRFLQYRVKDSAPVQDYSGKEMPAAPDTLTAEIGYRPVANARVALELVRQGGYWMNNANTVRYPGHTLFNLRGDCKLPGGWDAWLQGRNLTNRLYADNASSSYTGIGAYSPATMDTYSAGAPRSIMIGLDYRFDGKK